MLANRQTLRFVPTGPTNNYRWIRAAHFDWQHWHVLINLANDLLTAETRLSWWISMLLCTARRGGEQNVWSQNKSLAKKKKHCFSSTFLACVFIKTLNPASSFQKVRWTRLGIYFIKNALSAFCPERDIRVQRLSYIWPAEGEQDFGISGRKCSGVNRRAIAP